MPLQVTIIVNPSNTEAGSFNIYQFVYDSNGDPQADPFLLESNVPTSSFIDPGYVIIVDENAYGIRLVSNNDRGFDCEVTSIDEFFSNVKIVNNFPPLYGNISITGAAFGGYSLTPPPPQNASPYYYRIDTGTTVEDTASVDINNESINTLSYVLTIRDSESSSSFIYSSDIPPTTGITINIDNTFLSSARQYVISLGTYMLPSKTPSKTPSLTPSLTPSITITPSLTPSITITPSLTPSITITPSLTPSKTPSLTPGETPSITPSETPSLTPSETPSLTPSETPSITPSETPTPSMTPSLTPSETPSLTPSETPSITPSETPTPSMTPSLTPSETPTPSMTPSLTPSETPTPTITPSTSPPPVGNFILDSAYGIKFSGVTGTGIPSFSYPVTSGNTTLTYTGTISEQDLSVEVYGNPAPSGDKYLILRVNGSQIDTETITNGDTTETTSVTKSLHLTETSAPTEIIIRINNSV
jgi:hypothetical protein